jgi:hypothetical protein
MIIAVKRDGRFEPVEEGWRGWLDDVDLSTFQFALAPGVVGCGATEDHEVVVNDRKVVILLLVIALVLLRPLAGVTLSLSTFREVAFHHVTFLEGVLDRALVVWAWFLEHLVKNSQAALERGLRVLAFSSSHKGVLA